MANRVLGTIRGKLSALFNETKPTAKKFALVETVPDPNRMDGGKHTYHRIQALVDIPRHGVKAGDLGGLVEDERNLSQAGDCWIGVNARVAEGVRVKDNALVTDNARLLNKTRVEGNAIVGGETSSNMSALFDGNAQVTGKTYIGHRSHIGGSAKLDSVFAEGSIQVSDGVHTGNMFASARGEQKHKDELSRLDAENAQARDSTGSHASDALGKNIVRAGLGLPLKF